MNKIEKAKEVLRDAGYFIENLWHKNDIDDICIQNDISELSHKEIKEFWEYYNKNFNAEIGMNLESLEVSLIEFIELNHTPKL